MLLLQWCLIMHDCIYPCMHVWDFCDSLLSLGGTDLYWLPVLVLSCFQFSSTFWCCSAHMFSIRITVSTHNIFPAPLNSTNLENPYPLYLYKLGLETFTFTHSHPCWDKFYSYKYRLFGKILRKMHICTKDKPKFTISLFLSCAFWHKRLAHGLAIASSAPCSEIPWTFVKHVISKMLFNPPKKTPGFWELCKGIYSTVWWFSHLIP